MLHKGKKVQDVLVTWLTGFYKREPWTERLIVIVVQTNIKLRGFSVERKHMNHRRVLNRFYINAAKKSLGLLSSTQ